MKLLSMDIVAILSWSYVAAFILISIIKVEVFEKRRARRCERYRAERKKQKELNKHL